MLTNTHLKPQETFTKSIKKDGNDYDILIHVFSEPVRKSAEVSCFTYVNIRHEGEEWGHLYMQQPVPADGAAGVFDMVRKHLTSFKNQG